MFKSLSLKVKLPSIIVGFALVSLIAAVTAAAFSSWSAISNLTEARLTATAQSRATELTRCLDSLTADMASLSSSPATLDAAFSALGPPERAGAADQDLPRQGV